MKLLSSRTHGYLDYIVATLLIAAPWLFGFYREGAETWVPVGAGLATVIYSLFTRYELGAFQLIPMGVHLMLDVLQGIFLAASPWLLGFADHVWAPHLIVGIMEVIVVLFTSRASALKNIRTTAPAS